MVARSDPQTPDRMGRTLAHPGPGGSGSLLFTSRIGASGPDTRPGIRLPTALAVRYRGAERNSSSAWMVTPTPASLASSHRRLGEPDQRHAARHAPVLDGPSPSPGNPQHGVVRR